MTYRSVLFRVPVHDDEETDDDPKDWVRRELVLEGLLGALHAAARPAHVAAAKATEPEPAACQ